MRRFSIPTCCAYAICLAALAAPSVASAEDRTLVVGYQPAWFVLAGATGGASFGADENGGYLGVEVSAARMLRGWWYGIYGDALYDFGTAVPSLSFGPEFGYWLLGVDGGVALRPGAQRVVDFGPTVRGMLTLGLFSLYYRRSFWPNAVENRTVSQVGLLLKLPVGASWGAGSEAAANVAERTQ